MPTYEYECSNCNNRFEIFQSMKDEPVKVCPECGKEVHRLISGGGGVIYKGTGFYSTDRGLSDHAANVKDAKKAKEAAAKNPVPPAAACSGCEKAKSGECGAA
jgi:putative FmdB family regulatory protein